MRFRRLLPACEDVEVEALLAELVDVAPADDERPYTLVNFVHSVDGRATLQGRSGGLGDDGDRAMFHGLREQVDAVLAGTGTLVTERYGRMLGKAERRERRADRGLAPEPLAVVISRSGTIPTDIPLFAEPDARVAVFTATEPDLDAVRAQVAVEVLDPGELTLTTVMRSLRATHDVERLLCEGGPTMFTALLQEQLVDELFLTVAPKLAGGGHGPTITSGPELIEALELEIVWLVQRNGSLYLRYRLP